MPCLIDMSGKVFGAWTALERCGSGKDGNAFWLCICECGERRAINGRSLRYGLSKSCGCRTGEAIAEGNRKHGMSYIPEYMVWALMKNRCSNPNYTHYKNYGGRGITVCDSWLSGFEAFYADMGPRPSNQHSLDRIDNSKGYSPDNCRWATSEEQSRNKRSNRSLTHNGRTLCVMDWAKELGITQQALQKRLKTWPVDRALSEPAHTRQKR